MRTVLIGDAVAAARALLPLPQAARPAMMARLLYEAHLADCCRKRLGRGHPRFGNGTLMDAASRHPQPPEPFLDDAEYLSALLTVLAALLARKRRENFFPACAFPAKRADHRSP